MITLTSTNQDPQVLADAFAAHGYKPEAPTSEEGRTAVQGEKVEKEATGETPVEGEKHSESDPAKGEDPKVETKTETPVEEKPKEEAKVEGEPAAKPKSKGGFQARNEKLTAEKARLQERLDEERGDKERLQKQLDEVNAKLAELQPKKDEPKNEGPVRPKRPTKAEFEYDEDKYEAAMGEYETKLDAYHRDVAKAEAAAEVAALKKEQETKAAEDAQKERIAAFVKRRDEGKASIPDFDEVMDELPEGAETLTDRSATARNYIMNKAKNPAALMHFFAKDYLEGNEAEADRLLALDDYDLVIELRDLETRLTAKKVDPTPNVDPAAKKAGEPVKPQPKPKQAAPEPPIEPVGGRGHQSSVLDLEQKLREAKDPVEYRRIRALIKAAKQPARVA